MILGLVFVVIGAGIGFGASFFGGTNPAPNNQILPTVANSEHVTIFRPDGNMIDTETVIDETTTPTRTSFEAQPNSVIGKETIWGNPNSDTGKVVITFMAEGYTASEQDLFIQRATEGTNFLLGLGGQTGVYPFNVFRDVINVHAIKIASNNSGVSNNVTGNSISTYFGAHWYYHSTAQFNTLGWSGNPPTSAINALKNTYAPSTSVVTVLANVGATYGSTGTAYTDLNFCIVAANTWYFADVVKHELGHALGNLADEYTYGDQATQVANEYARHRIGTARANVAFTDNIVGGTPTISTSTVKWSHLSGFNNVGVFSFASGSISIPVLGTVSVTMYRPHNTCGMNSTTSAFCAVCQEHLIVGMAKISSLVVSAVAPTISAQPSNINTTQGGSATLWVSATSSDPGNVSYQWYRNTTNSTSGGTLISGATGTSYTAPTTSQGTLYYYAIATNTNLVVNGTKTATATSNVASVTVPQTFTINASADTDGTISPSGAISVGINTTQTFTFAANSGYEIDQVLINGINNTVAVTAGTYTFSNIATNHTIAVSFKLKTYTINAAAGANGTISQSGSVPISHGGAITFTFAPNNGYSISQVLVNGTNNTSAVNSGSYTFTNVTTNHTIAVSFAIKTYTIHASVGLGGTISSSGEVSVNHFSNRTFTFAPSTGYEIDQVLINGVNNATAVSAGSYTFTNITGNNSITVFFRAKYYTITVTYIAAGFPDTVSTLTAGHGSNEIIEFTPGPGFAITQVLVNGVANSAAKTAQKHTFNYITSNQVITIFFGVATDDPEQPPFIDDSGTGSTQTPDTDDNSIMPIVYFSIGGAGALIALAVLIIILRKKFIIS